MQATVNEAECEAPAQPAETSTNECLTIFRKPEAPLVRAERRDKADVPWLSTVKFPWGLEVNLLNISSTGLLIESGSKLTPGNVTEIKLCGADTELVIPICFVRSEIATVDHVGVKYRTAATFGAAVPLLDPSPASPEPSSPNAALSHLLRLISQQLDRSADASARTALERAVRQAVNARNIEIRDVPMAPDDGSESIYFTVPTGAASPPILQAMFAPDHEPTELEFKLLKAAAGLAAVVLQFEERR